jgi:hypothetical protein
MRAEVFLCFQVARPFRLSFQFLGLAAVLFRFGQHEHQRRHRVRPPGRLTLVDQGTRSLVGTMGLEGLVSKHPIDHTAAAGRSTGSRSRTGSIRRCSAESCSGSNHLRCPAALGVDHLREKPILGEMPNLLRTGAIPRWIESSDFAIKKRNGHTSSVESALCLLSSE